MEAAAALASFVGMAGPFAQGLEVLYDLMTNMKNCPKDIRDMRTDLEPIEDLIMHVIRQCDQRNLKLRKYGPQDSQAGRSASPSHNVTLISQDAITSVAQDEHIT